jgi:hypothetical protein
LPTLRPTFKHTLSQSLCHSLLMVHLHHTQLQHAKLCLGSAHSPMRSVLLVGAVALGLSARAMAEIVSGTINGGSEALVVLAKFAFGFDPTGAIVGLSNISVTTGMTNLGVYWFDDEPYSWPAVVKSGYDCQTATSSQGGSQPFKSMSAVLSNMEWFWEQDFREVTHPRFWYVALATFDCSPIQGLTSYSVNMTQANGNPLSNDQMDMPAYSGLIFAVWLPILALHVWFTHWRSIGKQPLQLQWLSAVIGVGLVAALLNVIHWGGLQQNGVGCWVCFVMGSGLEQLLVAMLWGILMLTASGVGIVPDAWKRPGPSSPLSSVVVLVVLLIMEAVLGLWFAVARNVSDTSYVMDTGPGIALVVVQALGGLWFLYCAWNLRRSIKQPGWTNRLIAVGVWAFSILPIAAILGASVSPYDMYDAVTIPFQGFVLIGIAGIEYLFQPHVASFLYTTEPTFTADTLLPSGEDADALLFGTVE